MRNRIYITIIIAIFLISLASANMIFKFGQEDVEYRYIVNNSVSNRSDYWDSLDTPADIDHNDLFNKQGGAVGERYHLNQSVYDIIIANIYDWVTDISNYFTKTEIIAQYYNKTETTTQYYNKTDIDGMDLGNSSWNQSLANNLYANISLVDTNESTRVINIVDTNCSAGNYSYGFHANGTLLCRSDTSGGGVGGGTAYDQSLNTTDNVSFAQVQTNQINSTFNSYLYFNETSGSLELWV